MVSQTGGGAVVVDPGEYESSLYTRNVEGIEANGFESIVVPRFHERVPQRQSILVGHPDFIAEVSRVQPVVS